MQGIPDYQVTNSAGEIEDPSQIPAAPIDTSESVPDSNQTPTDQGAEK